MKFTVLMALALAGTALAQNSTFTTSTTTYPSTTIVSALTTVCGAATALTQNGNYYTCTEAMTLTITDCPCTMTRPSYIQTYAAASPTTPASTIIIFVPASCPSTTTSTSTAPSTLQQNPAQGAQGSYTPPCQAAGSASYTPSSQGQAMGTATLPSATHYAYTNGSPGGAAAAAGAGVVWLAIAAAGAAACALWV